MKRKRKKQKSIILRLVILGICAYFTITLAGLWNQLNKSKAELASYKQQFAAMTVEVEELHAILESDSDKQIVEKAARERLGYIYPGEQIFRANK